MRGHLVCRCAAVIVGAGFALIGYAQTTETEEIVVQATKRESTILDVEDVSGNPLNRAPENSLGIVADYKVPLSNGGELAFSPVHLDRRPTVPAF